MGFHSQTVVIVDRINKTTSN